MSTSKYHRRINTILEEAPTTFDPRKDRSDPEDVRDTHVTINNLSANGTAEYRTPMLPISAKALQTCLATLPDAKAIRSTIELMPSKRLVYLWDTTAQVWVKVTE